MKRIISVQLILALCVYTICGCESKRNVDGQSPPQPTVAATLDSESAGVSPSAEATLDMFEKKPAEGFLVLVNFDNRVNAGYRPNTLVAQGDVFGNEVILQNPEGSIDRTAAQAAKSMFQAASREGMCRYVLTTAFRSVKYQTKLFKEKIAECGEDYAANPYQNPVSVMPGGASEHHTGLALDILSENHREADDAFGMTREGQWLIKNAHRYGFILRYPKGKEHITGVIYEPWHFRYVGTEDARFMWEHGLCLEEYVNAG